MTFLIPEIYCEHGRIELSPEEYTSLLVRNPKFISNWQCVPPSFRLSYFIGVVRLSKTRAIYVEPKVNSGEAETDYFSMTQNILENPELARYTSDLINIDWESEPVALQQKQDILTPLLIARFMAVVKALVKKGVKKSYYRVQRNLSAKVKGKILVNQTLSQNTFKNKTLHTYCEFEEYGVNTTENKLIKMGLEFCRKYATHSNVSKNYSFITTALDFTMPFFSDVIGQIKPEEIKEYRNSPFYQEYDEAIKLSKIIVRRFGYNIANVVSEQITLTPPFQIDMSLLFELYVGSYLIQKYPGKIHYQFGAARGESYYGRPDYLYFGATPLIIDTKYKLKYNESNYWIDDIRQIAGYARDKRIIARLGHKTNEVPKCLIIYPKSRTLPDQTQVGENSVEQFSEFYKLAVTLPLVGDNKVALNFSLEEIFQK